MTVIVDGYATEYAVQGSGPVVLFLHGWGDRLATFDLLTRGLVDSFTVVTLDLPGFGKTDAPRVAFSLENYASFVQQFLNKINLSNVYCIIGHSNGGAIAIKGLSTKKLRAQQLVLLASAGVRSDYKGRKKALRYSTKIIKYGTVVLPNRTRQKIKKYAYQKVGSDMFVAEHLLETFKKIISEDVVGEAASITIPTLLVYGDEDQATPLSYGERFASSMPNAHLISIAGAGHFIHQSHADRVLHEIHTFLEKKKS